MFVLDDDDVYVELVDSVVNAPVDGLLVPIDDAVIVLFDKVSVVALPTRVSVTFGNDSVPEVVVTVLAPIASVPLHVIPVEVITPLTSSVLAGLVLFIPTLPVDVHVSNAVANPVVLRPKLPLPTPHDACPNVQLSPRPDPDPFEFRWQPYEDSPPFALGYSLTIPPLDPPATFRIPSDVLVFNKVAPVALSVVNAPVEGVVEPI
jgi:hypothetical protein